MVNITITPGQISYVDSVLGSVSYGYVRETVQVVDDISIHIETEKGFRLYNLQQYKFNGNVYESASDVVDLINSLV
jgi:hypothetical protein